MRQLAEEATERVLRPELIVAVRKEQHGARRPDAPANELEQIEARLIGPVNVLEDGDGLAVPRRELAQKRAEEILAARTGSERRGQLSRIYGRHVQHRPQRTWCEQSVTRSPADADFPLRQSLDEVF